MDKYMLCALGANLDSPAGPPAVTLEKALIALIRKGFSLVSVSRFWRTPAYPAGSGPDFVNACCKLRASFDARETLDLLHQVEAEFGRERNCRWQARVLDLDLVDFDGQILPDPETQARWRDLPPEAQISEAPDRLILPHPRLQDRGFVLIPLADIAPGWRHPVSGRSVTEMIAALPAADRAGIRPISGADHPNRSLSSTV